MTSHGVWTSVLDPRRTTLGETEMEDARTKTENGRVPRSNFHFYCVPLIKDHSTVCVCVCVCMGVRVCIYVHLFMLTKFAKFY